MGDSLRSTVFLRLHRTLAWMPVSVARHAVATAFLVEAPQTNPDRFTGTTQRLRCYDSYASSIDSATATLAAAPNARDYNGAR